MQKSCKIVENIASGQPCLPLIFNFFPLFSFIIGYILLICAQFFFVFFADGKVLGLPISSGSVFKNMNRWLIQKWFTFSVLFSSWKYDQTKQSDASFSLHWYFSPILHMKEKLKIFRPHFSHFTLKFFLQTCIYGDIGNLFRKRDKLKIVLKCPPKCHFWQFGAISVNFLLHSFWKIHIVQWKTISILLNEKLNFRESA